MFPSDFQSKVLNLYSDDSTHHLRVKPESTRALFQYDGGVLPVEFPKLTVQDVDVYDKMAQNTTDINYEINRANAYEAKLLSDVQNESSRASGVEEGLQGELDAEKARVAARETFDVSALATEVAARQSADASFTATISAEIASREAADSIHTVAIAAESSRADTEEKRLDGLINQNWVELIQRARDIEDQATLDRDAESARMDAIESKAAADYSEFDERFGTSGTDNTSKFDALTLRVDGILSNTDPASLDSLAEIVQKFSADGVDYAQRLTNLESVIQQLVEQLSE